jgi:hypothetical protein
VVTDIVSTVGRDLAVRHVEVEPEPRHAASSLKPKHGCPRGVL